MRWKFAATGRADSVVVEASVDGTTWTPLARRGNAPANAWQTLTTDATARYVRFAFRNPKDDKRIGYLSEVEIRGSAGT
ncbi:MAG: discoidin domain-containing protein [Chloroflexota bacterium]|nr:discoidin domain-containing protein [Chloroflexota bacterium]